MEINFDGWLNLEKIKSPGQNRCFQVPIDVSCYFLPCGCSRSEGDEVIEEVEGILWVHGGPRGCWRKVSWNGSRQVISGRGGGYAKTDVE